MIPSSRRVLFGALATVSLACGGEGSSEPPTPSEVVAITPSAINGVVVGSLVAAAPTFEVRTASGRALAGVPVTVSVTSGGGTLAGAPTTSLAGPTSIGQWTLGTVAGAQTVTVTSGTLAPLVFTAQSVPGAPTELQSVEGNNQFGSEGQAVTTAPKVRVRDAFANAVAGATVNWSVTQGGGTVAAASSVSDAQGIATAPVWTLGATGPGEQRLQASLNALSTSFSAFTGVQPASIEIEVPAPATATVGTTLATAPAFTVRSAEDVVISGFPVTVTLTGGGGTLVGAPTQTGAAATAIGTWTMGTASGAQEVTVSVAGVAPVTFTVQATAGPTTSLQVVQGADQSAPAGDLVPVPPQVRLLDQYGNRVTNSPVFWAVSEGGGSLASGQTQSNGDGEALAPAWRLGKSAVAQQITAIAGAGQAAIGANVATDYNVVIRWLTPEPTGAIAAAFTNAVNRIRAVITGDLTDITVNLASPACGIPGPLNETVDDVVIYARVEADDGPGGTLGSAGPCYFRSSGTNPSTIPPTTIYGTMRFDVADLESLAAANRLEAVILHEMLHVIGVGTLWNQPSNALRLDTGLSSVRFIGEQAREACATVNGGTTTCATAVPVENCLDLSPGTNCGPGTINSHWKESTFQGELMTGYLSPGVNPFAAFTILSLADMSYQVNVRAADDYLVPGGSLQAGLVDALQPLLRMPEPLRPRFGITPDGRVVPALDQ